MHDNAEHNQDDTPRVVNATLPEWAKFAMSIGGTIILVLGWVEARFVSRVEWNQHATQQQIDMGRLVSVQEKYAIQEGGTAANLSEINSRLTRIETLLERPKFNGSKP